MAGAGVGGLAATLALARAGHHVTLVDRDPFPTAADPEAAFATERAGAPQVHHTHGLLARLVVELRRALPDVLDDLLAVGRHRPSRPWATSASPSRATRTWRCSSCGARPSSGCCGASVLAEPNVEVRTGAAVTGLVVDGTVPPVIASASAAPGGTAPVPTRCRPRRGAPVAGVVLDGGDVIAADMVVAANGRRSAVPRWLDEAGVTVPEVEHPSGLVYLTRWYRLAGDVDVPLDGRLGRRPRLREVPGRARATPARCRSRSPSGPTDSDAAQPRCSAPGGFEEACRVPCPAPTGSSGPVPLEPIGAGAADGRASSTGCGTSSTPAAARSSLGFHAVGDAHTCTNPLYGRGCSLALVQALRWPTPLAAHPGDPLGRAVAYEAACGRRGRAVVPRVGADGRGRVRPDGRRARRQALDSGQRSASASCSCAAATDPVHRAGPGEALEPAGTRPPTLAGDIEFGSPARPR